MSTPYMYAMLTKTIMTFDENQSTHALMKSLFKRIKLSSQKNDRERTTTNVYSYVTFDIIFSIVYGTKINSGKVLNLHI